MHALSLRDSMHVDGVDHRSPSMSQHDGVCLMGHHVIHRRRNRDCNGVVSV
jgi:hypothetical protein